MYENAMRLDKIGEPAKHVVCDAGSNQLDRERVVMAKNHLSADRLRETPPTDDERHARLLFGRQKRAAKNRNISWEMTFAEWFGIWESSGHWAERGRNAGGYVMSRNGDIGPYSAANVCIVTNKANFMEARSHAQRRDGVYCTLPGASRPWVARWKNKHVGYFSTEEEARAARQAAQLADPPPAWMHPSGRGWLYPPTKGLRLSDDHRKKLSEAGKAAHARKRAAST
jgi:hypothetical protein